MTQEITKKPHNEYIREDVMRLRDEFSKRAFSDMGVPINADLAEVVWKLNSCLFNGYPKLTAACIPTTIDTDEK